MARLGPDVDAEHLDLVVGPVVARVDAHGLDGFDDVQALPRGEGRRPVSYAASTKATEYPHPPHRPTTPTLTTEPKIVCLPSSHGVGTVVMNHWLPFVPGPALAMARRKGRSKRTEREIWGRSGGSWGWREQRRGRVHAVPFPHLILELAPPDGLAARAVALGVARLDHKALDNAAAEAAVGAGGGGQRERGGALPSLPPPAHRWKSVPL